MKPRALSAGSSVSLVCSSGPIRPVGRLELAVASVESLGFRVKVSPSCRAEYGYLAGTDAERAAALNEALADPETEAVFFAKGGYGAPRILDKIDWAAFACKPKILAGYSDVTSIHLAARRCGVPSFHVPMASSDFAEGIDEWTREIFLKTLLSRQALGQIALPPGSPPPQTLGGGKARGILVGGNLSLIVAAMGTPFELDTRGAILFLEDVGEEPYRIDRMLTQLRLAGKFDHCSGIVLGDWKNCEAEPKVDKPSLSLDQVFEDTLRACGKPILAGFPAGHRRPTAMFPLDVEAELDAGAGTLKILEAATE